MKRTQERKEAFYLIFESEYRRDETVQELFDTAAESRNLVLTDYIKNTVNGVCGKKEELDAVYSPYLKKWTVERLPSVARTILRLAVYEMKFTDLADNIAINEAVELAKEFETDDIPSFVNGVLGSVSREGKEQKA